MVSGGQTVFWYFVCVLVSKTMLLYSHLYMRTGLTNLQLWELIDLGLSICALESVSEYVCVQGALPRNCFQPRLKAAGTLRDQGPLLTPGRKGTHWTSEDLTHWKKKKKKRADSLEKTLVLGKIEGRRRRGHRG